MLTEPIPPLAFTPDEVELTKLLTERLHMGLCRSWERHYTDAEPFDMGEIMRGLLTSEEDAIVQSGGSVLDLLNAMRGA